MTTIKRGAAVLDELVKRVAHMGSLERLWRRGDTIVIALSGGPDSIALLHILQTIAEQEQVSLVAAHANHGFREESALEAVAAEGFCRQLHIPFEYCELDVPTYLRENPQNSQLAARELRYAFLHRVARQSGASRIALGHHRDDQAETVLMRLLRGTGLSGLSGIPIRRVEKNVELIRPLLRITKAELLEYCSRHTLPYSEDASNLQRYYLRNTVRLDVLPYLEQFNPNLSHSLARLADIAGTEDDLLDKQTAELFERHVLRTEAGLSMERKALLDLHIALQRRLIKLILNYLVFDKAAVSFDTVELVREAAVDTAKTTLQVDLGSEIQFNREYNTLKWGHRLQASGNEDYLYSIGADTGRLVVREAEAEFVIDRIEAAEASAKPDNRYEAWFDMQQLCYPLIIRNRRPGDRMALLGLNGTKKVQDMFVDEKVPSSLRGRWPIVSDAQERLLWIPGLRRSAHAVPGANAAAMLRIRMKQAKETGSLTSE
ncbi:tRNA lysidine(34) synthetase TilS [Paenibacillaceae bacterium]|nr:tRNA lysidine(34) synthetase TilS [Paenibacillaceae bacterium]